MKRTLFWALTLCLVLSVSALGQDEGLKGKSFISGYGGYTVGMGDPWGDQEVNITLLGIPVEMTSKLDPTLSFGAMYHYGVSDKLMLGCEIGFQTYDEEASAVVGGMVIPPESLTETKANILFNGLYALNYVEGEKGFYITFGGGIYGGLGGVLDFEQALTDAAAGKDIDEGGAAFGFNGGILYTHMVSEGFGLFVMPRFHFISSDPTSKMVTISAGVQFPLGG